MYSNRQYNYVLNNTLRKLKIYHKWIQVFPKTLYCRRRISFIFIEMYTRHKEINQKNLDLKQCTQSTLINERTTSHLFQQENVEINSLNSSTPTDTIIILEFII